MLRMRRERCAQLSSMAACARGTTRLDRERSIAVERARYKRELAPVATRPGQVKLLEATDQCAARESEEPRGPRLVPVARIERLLDAPLLGVLGARAQRLGGLVHSEHP